VAGRDLVGAAEGLGLGKAVQAEEKREEKKSETIQILSKAGVFHAFAWGWLENISCRSGILHVAGSCILFHQGTLV
jgi:hypothetical protein